jgi:ubiquinone/menaquinone biosynthesis C-methylase UbiE
MDRAIREYLGGSSTSEKRVWTDVNGWMHLQSIQWEPAGQRLLDELGDGRGLRVVDMGCGPLGWLRLLSRWVGLTGEVVGTELAEGTAEAAWQTVRSEGLSNVEVVVDDIFDSSLADHSFDLVHARMVLGPLGRVETQLATFRRLVKPGGWLVLEEPDMGAWRYNPAAPANERLATLMVEEYERMGRDVTIGRRIRTLMREFSERPGVRAHILALLPGHQYRAWPLMGAAAIREPIGARIGMDEFDRLMEEAHRELADPEVWCTSFALMQGFVRMP